jgi:hypothetical protein
LGRFILILTVLLSLLSTSEAAVPSPLGLTLGKTTLKEVEKRYGCSSLGFDPRCHCFVCQLNLERVKQLAGFRSVREAVAFFDEKGRLVFLSLTFPSDEFLKLLKVLKRKYEPVKLKLSIIGDKVAVFKADGGTFIYLKAPVNTFDVYLTYATKEAVEAILKEAKSRRDGVSRNL